MRKYYIFDLDGTLLNTLDDLWASVNHSLAQNYLPPRSKEEVRSFLGNGAKELLRKSVPSDCDTQTFEQVFACFRQHYVAHAMDTTRPYEGVIELLAQLKNKGIRTAIVSNKPDAAVQELYHHFFEDVVDIAIGECPEVRRKPSPDMLLKALEQLGCSQDDALYVGDSEVDIATASNSGLPCISVSWGFRDRDFLLTHGATVIIDHPSELLNINY
jgi:phosphoglycolate phosphatase